MKSLFAAIVLAASVSAFAESITLTVPKSGRYIIHVVAAEDCTPKLFAMTETTMGSDPVRSRDVVVSEIVNTDITPTVCRKGANIATGIFNLQAKTKLVIDLDGAQGNLAAPKIIMERVTQTQYFNVNLK